MPFGVARLSREFLDAGIATKAPPKDALQELVQPAPLVAFYLIGHSIELSLKAFLLGRGESITALRSKRFGHDLSALLVESRRRKLGTCVKLSSTEIRVVHMLNDCYSSKELEYLFNGTRRLPHYSVTVRIAEKLHAGVDSFCRKIMANNSSKRTR